MTAVRLKKTNKQKTSHSLDPSNSCKFHPHPFHLSHYDVTHSHTPLGSTSSQHSQNQSHGCCLTLISKKRPDTLALCAHIIGGTRLKFESWKRRNHTQNASQSRNYCFVKDIWILKPGCSLKSPTHDICITNAPSYVGHAHIHPRFHCTMVNVLVYCQRQRVVQHFICYVAVLVMPIFSSKTANEILTSLCVSDQRSVSYFLRHDPFHVFFSLLPILHFGSNRKLITCIFISFIV